MVLFVDRLTVLIRQSGLTQAAFARQTGLDSSTLSLLLSGDGRRAPSAQTLIALATSWHVSTDWLLGLTDEASTGTDIVQSVARIERHTRAPSDSLFLTWLRENEGSRIRTAIDGIPNFLKTEEIIRFEYQGYLGGSRPFDAVQQRLALMRRPQSNLEVCISMESLSTLALAESKWSGLNVLLRIKQLEHMLQLYGELYPRLIVYCYTLTEAYSSPFTLFGREMVSLFIGDKYLVLRRQDLIQEFSDQFDNLIKLAVIQPSQFGGLIEDLITEAHAIPV